MYIGSYFIDKIFLSKDKASQELERSLRSLKKVRVKDLEDQKRYLDMVDDKKKMYGDPFNKFLFYILMLIGYSVLVSYMPNKILLILSIPAYSILAPLGYMFKDKANPYRFYNFWTMFLTFTFFSSYIVLQTLDPLTFMGFRMNLLFLLPILFLVNIIVDKVGRKIKKSTYIK
jgi:hypothetical protein